MDESLLMVIAVYLRQQIKPGESPKVAGAGVVRDMARAKRALNELRIATGTVPDVDQYRVSVDEESLKIESAATRLEKQQ